MWAYAWRHEMEQLLQNDEASGSCHRLCHVGAPGEIQIQPLSVLEEKKETFIEGE